MPDLPRPVGDSPPDELLAIRAKIDDVDHRLLEVLRERNDLIHEVAAIKRSHRLAIRDEIREIALLKDRRAFATDHGLREEVVESLFRLVMWASRDRQAALKAELPPTVEPKTIAIIGAKGGMGRMLTSLFGSLGHEVIGVDLETDPTIADAVAAADVIAISVPIDVTPEVIAEVGPLTNTDQLLIDVTSIKTGPVAAMLQESTASVIGTHPLFGPDVHSLQGQRIVMTPAREVGSCGWEEWLETMLTARGLVTITTTPEAHDTAMSIVQVLTHFSTEVIGRALASMDVPIQETLKFTSPVYMMELLMTARHFAQSADLYASIEMSNPQTPKVLDAFVAAADELRSIVLAEDRPQFKAVFEAVHAYFGEFSTTAKETSTFLIDRLVERQG